MKMSTKLNSQEMNEKIMLPLSEGQTNKCQTLIAGIVIDKYFNLIKKHENTNHKTVASNKKGVVYTPSKIASEMVELLDPKIDESIWDPSCGSGIFIFAILLYIQKKYNPTAQEIEIYIREYLYFSDIDKQALDNTKKLLAKFLKENYGLVNLELNAMHEDALLNTKHYDCIVCNPPYIRTKNLDEEYLCFLRENFSFCKKGNIDIYYAFIELCNKYSNRACTITPNSFIINNFASILRNSITSNISYIRDYKDDKQFESASTYTAIILLDKNAGDTFEYAEYNNPTKIMHRSRLYADKWYLDGPINNINFNPNKNQNLLKFGDIVDIYTRIQTSANKLFIVITKKDSEKYHSIKHNGTKYDIEAELCLKLKKINTYLGAKQTKDEAIIFPYNKNTNKIIDRSEMKEKYPKTYKYLLAIKNNLLSRDKGRINRYEEWYSYGRKQGLSQNFKNKECILVPSTFKIDNFVCEAIVSKEKFLHSSGFVIIPKEGKQKLVKSILIDPSFEEYLNQYAKKLSGGYNLITAKQIKDYTFAPVTSFNSITYEAPIDTSCEAKLA